MWCISAACVEAGFFFFFNFHHVFVCLLSQKYCKIQPSLFVHVWINFSKRSKSSWNLDHSWEIYTCKKFMCVTQLHDNVFNSSWPSDAIWRSRSGSPLALMTYCLMALSHYLNQQYWPRIPEYRWTYQMNMWPTLHECPSGPVALWVWNKITPHCRQLFQSNFLEWNKCSLILVPKHDDSRNNKSSLVQIMVWCWACNNP